MTHKNSASDACSAGITPTALSFGERFVIGLWRSVISVSAALMSLFNRPPKGRITEHQYGALFDERLDWVRADAATAKRTPVVHIHGGGWVSGSKGALYTKQLLQLAGRGHPVFSVNHPLAPEHPHPTTLQSVVRALAWIKAEHPEIDKVFLIGDSAGGNVAMMLGILRANPAAFGIFSADELAELPEVAGIFSMYGVLDRFTWIEDGFPSARLFLKSYAGEASLDKNTDLPIAVTPMDLPDFEHLPPTFIAAASKDKLLRSSRICAERLRAKFDNVELKVYEGAAHGFFSFGTKSKELNDDLANFLSRTG